MRLHVVGEREANGGGHVVAPAQRLRRALGHDVPGRQHGDPVGQVFRLVQVVGGEEDGLAKLPEPGDDVPGGAAGGRVESSGRLVQEDELWVSDEGEREVEPAPLAAGEPGAERARLSGETGQGDGLVDIPRRAIEPGYMARHSRTDRPGSGSDSCKTRPTRSRQAPPAVAGSCPRTETCPAVRCWKPSRISTVVVLPAPFGPRKAKISSFCNDTSTPETATLSLHDALPSPTWPT